MGGGQWLAEFFSGPFAFYAYWAVLAVIAAVESFTPAAHAPVPGRLRVNFALGLVTAILTLVPTLSAVAIAQWARDGQLGLFNQFEMPVWLSATTAFLLLDLARYGVHRLSHRWEPLWRIHRVHHGDPDVDLSTLFRQHPLAVLLVLSVDAAIIAGLGLEPLGVMAYTAAAIVVMPLAHAQLRPMPRLSEVAAQIVVTPRFHHVHHSALRSQTDSNYGELLTIWDTLFGTASRDETVARYGLGEDNDTVAGDLRAQLVSPFARS